MDGPKTDSTRERIKGKMAMATKLMEENLEQLMTIKDLASAISMAESYFSHNFKHIYGISPYRFYLHLRLNAAKEKLEKSLFTIGEIATATGFSELSTFSRCFKKQFGIAPKKYRKVFFKQEMINTIKRET